MMNIISMAGSSGSSPKKPKLPDGTKFGYSTKPDILANVDTSEMTDMNSMFKSCKFSSLELSLDTSKATTMFGMFAESTINVTFNIDTGNVSNMVGMFERCKTTKLDLSSFDTSKVTDIRWMFNGCTVQELDLSSFNLSKCTQAGNVFMNAHNISTLRLGEGFGRINVTSVSFSYLSLWTNESVATSLLALYDRAQNGMAALTITLHENTKAALTDEQIAAITAKGYTIA